ncbi:hypothetical protein SNE40_012787 [Patella caerulea]
MRSPIKLSKVACRNIKKISRDDFKFDLDNSQLLNAPPDDGEELVQLFNSTLKELLDKHAPVTFKHMRAKSVNPWYCNEIMQAKIERRTAERKWRLTKLEVHRQIYNTARNKVNFIIRKVKSSYHNDFIQSNSNNPKIMFSAMFSLLGRNVDSLLPTTSSDQQLVESFSDFFLSTKLLASEMVLETIHLQLISTHLKVMFWPRLKNLVLLNLLI